MVALATLNEELDQLRSERDVLRAKNPGATMPEEARAEDDRLVKRMSGVITLIEEAKQRERDDVAAKVVSYAEDPDYRIPRAVNADDEGRAILNKHGWSVKGGFVCRMTANGREQALYPEDVMFGAVPDAASDPAAAAYTRQVRAIMQPAYRDAWVNYLRQMPKSRSEAMAFSRLSGPEQNALSEGNDGAGGFVVPPDVQAEMLSRTAQMSVMTRLCRVVPTSRDILRFPAVAAHGSSGSIYSSGFVGGWVGETPAFSETDPSFEQFDIPIKKARTATKLSNDWLSDAAANMIAFLSTNGGENLGLVRDNGFIAGTGASNQPMGLLNHSITTVDIEGSTSNTVSNTISNVGSVPKIINLHYQVPAQYANNGTWLTCRALEGAIAGLVGADGRPVWQLANNAGLATGFGRSLLGYPLENSDFVPDDGADTNKVLVFGDFRNYIIAQRTALSVVVLRERFADSDQTGIILFERTGGGCWNTDAFRIGIV